MYESPINIIIQDIESQMAQQTEQMILETIRKCGVDVDKNELIKALNYDRNQYSKGYKDGVNDVLEKIRAEIIEYEGNCRLSEDEYPSCKQCTDSVFETIYEIIDKYKKRK